jgi:hypothetical protein
MAFTEYAQKRYFASRYPAVRSRGTPGFAGEDLNCGA